MTPLEMIQEFQVHYDMVDNEALPKMYPEEILLFLNDATITLSREARKVFEGDTQLAEDLRTLVYDGVIQGLATPTQTFFPLNLIKQVGFEDPEDPYVKYLYTGKVYGQGTYKGIGGKVNLRETTHNQWEAALANPHAKPRPSQCPYRFTNQGIMVAHPTTLSIPKVYISFIKYPALIQLPAAGQPGVSCDLPEQLHLLVVQEAVRLAQKSILQGAQLTRGER